MKKRFKKIQEKTSRKITLLTTQSKDIIKDISEDAINKIRHEIINEKAKFLMMRNKIESNGRTIIKLASHIKMLKNKKNHSMIKTQADIKNLCINKEKNKSRFEYRRMNHCSTILTPKHSEGDKIKIKSFADFIASEKNNSIKSL